MNREKFREIHDLLMEQLDVSRELSDEEILEVIDELILNQSKELFFSLKEKVGLRQELFCSVRKLDVLQELIEDESITEIMVNGPDNIFVERAGKLTRWNKTFTSKEKLEDVIQQIVGRCNRVVNESMPIVDARLENGARVNKKGLALYVRRNRPDRRNVEQQSSAQISFLKMYYEYVVKCKTADIPENEKDVWDMRKLDIVPRSNPIRGRYRLDFREIRQKEFKEIIKKILYSHCQTKAMGSIKGELRGFRRFASFMYDRFPEVKHFTEISRDMIEDYLVYIKTDTGLTSVSYTTELSVLDNLLDEIGRELEIGNICNLFLSSDCRAYDNALPEAYSDAEIRRFNCALTKLKPQLGRCLIIHQMLGTRIEDTLTLRRDCLSEKSGHYFITIIQQKTRKYKRPVSDQLAELIRKAIEVSEKEHPDSEYIFLQDNGKLYTDSMLKYHVNIMIYENDIRDDNGNYFEFRTHRFRHTFGVKLTEMKLDDDSIARLLGHKDTRTIPHYRRLRNEALAEDTKAVRDEMNELLAQYRREKENAETR